MVAQSFPSKQFDMISIEKLSIYKKHRGNYRLYSQVKLHYSQRVSLKDWKIITQLIGNLVIINLSDAKGGASSDFQQAVFKSCISHCECPDTISLLKELSYQYSTDV